MVETGPDHPPFFAYLGPHAPHKPSQPAPWYADHPIANTPLVKGPYYNYLATGKHAFLPREPLISAEDEASIKYEHGMRLKTLLSVTATDDIVLVDGGVVGGGVVDGGGSGSGGWWDVRQLRRGFWNSLYTSFHSTPRPTCMHVPTPRTRRATLLCSLKGGWRLQSDGVANSCGLLWVVALWVVAMGGFYGWLLWVFAMGACNPMVWPIHGILR